MYRVITYNLSEDMAYASPDFGQHEMGDLSLEDLTNVLLVLNQIDPVQNNEGEPFLTVSCGLEKITVRTMGGRLFIFNTRTPEAGSVEASIEEIIRQLDPANHHHHPEADTEGLDEPKRKRFTSNQIITIGMLVVGLALNGYTVYSALYIDDVRKEPSVNLTQDQAEAQRTREVMSGSYFTGHDQGDRSIIIYADGSLLLQELGRKSAVRKETILSYSPGKRGTLSVLKLKPRGQIEILNRDTLRLYGDTYRRAQ